MGTISKKDVKELLDKIEESDLWETSRCRRKGERFFSLNERNCQPIGERDERVKRLIYSSGVETAIFEEWSFNKYSSEGKEWVGEKTLRKFLESSFENYALYLKEVVEKGKKEKALKQAKDVLEDEVKGFADFDNDVQEEITVFYEKVGRELVLESALAFTGGVVFKTESSANTGRGMSRYSGVQVFLEGCESKGLEWKWRDGYSFDRDRPELSVQGFEIKEIKEDEIRFLIFNNNNNGSREIVVPLEAKNQGGQR